MDFRVFVEPQQGATYADQLAVARAAEALGLLGVLPVRPLRGDERRRPARARPTRGSRWPASPARRRRSGSARWSPRPPSAIPGPLAISVAQVDEMSGGRVELGIGAGWFEAEHQAYAIPFPPLGERFDRLTEQLDIITGLWTTPGRRDVRLPRHALHGRRLARAAQTRSVAAPADHHRRRRRQAHARAGRAVRRRVQRPVRAAGHGQDPVRPGRAARWPTPDGPRTR